MLDQVKSEKLIEAFGLQSEYLTLEPLEQLWDETLREIDGALDIKVEGLRRAEQSYARHRLLKGKSSGTCLLCGHTFNKDFLIAAHIKKRSACTDEEKRDIDSNMMLACIFGCDVLYEKGYIALVDGSIQVSSQLVDPEARAYTKRYTDRIFPTTTLSKQYFNWHAETVFKP